MEVILTKVVNQRDVPHRLMARARFSISEFCCLISLMKFMKTFSSCGISLGSVRLRFWYNVAACSFLEDKRSCLVKVDGQGQRMNVWLDFYFCSINFFLTLTEQLVSESGSHKRASAAGKSKIDTMMRCDV